MAGEREPLRWARREKAMRTEVLRRHTEVHAMAALFPSLATMGLVHDWCELYEMVFKAKCPEGVA